MWAGGHPESIILLYPFRCLCFKQFTANVHHGLVVYDHQSRLTGAGSIPTFPDVKLDVKRSNFNRHGAAAARRAHNPEVTGSKPVVGIQPITSHRCIKALEQPLNRHGAEEARGAHNSEVTRSKRVAGMITIQLLCRSSTRLHMDTLNRHGAAAARAAHNREDTRSKRVAGIHYITSHRCIKALEQPSNRHGAAEARGAHNSEDIRSKRIAGIFICLAPLAQLD